MTICDILSRPAPSATVSRNDGLGRGSGGASIGAVSIGTMAGVTTGAVGTSFCSTARAGAVSVINAMATLIGRIYGRFFRPVPTAENVRCSVSVNSVRSVNFWPSADIS